MRRSREERARIVERYEASGKTRREFAKSEGINYHTLQSWLDKSRRRGGKEEEELRFVEVSPPAGSFSHPRTMAEVRFSDGTVLIVRG